MPDNRMGENHTIDIPRAPVKHDPDFGVQRMLDGHIVPNDGIQDDETRNIHHP